MKKENWDETMISKAVHEYLADIHQCAKVLFTNGLMPAKALKPVTPNKKRLTPPTKA
jgi:hypothetical protein